MIVIRKHVTKNSQVIQMVKNTNGKTVNSVMTLLLLLLLLIIVVMMPIPTITAYIINDMNNNKVGMPFLPQHNFLQQKQPLEQSRNSFVFRKWNIHQRIHQHSFISNKQQSIITVMYSSSLASSDNDNAMNAQQQGYDENDNSTDAYYHPYSYSYNDDQYENKYDYNYNYNNKNQNFNATSSALQDVSMFSQSPLLASSSSMSSSWTVTDNWDTLSIENPDNAAIESRRQFDQRLAHGANDNVVSNLYSRVDTIINTSKRTRISTNDGQVQIDDEQERLENFINSMYLHDLSSSTTTTTDTDTDDVSTSFNEDIMSREIALLVRCNERPETILIQQGRALPDLTTEQLQNVSQLLQLQVLSVSDNDDDDNNNTTTNTQQLQWVPTQFLQQAVHTMYQQHATVTIKVNGHEQTIQKFDARAIASWLQTAWKLPTVIGQHDQRVLTVIAKYGSYGCNYLTESELLNLYVMTILGTKTDTSTSIVSIEQLQKQRANEIQHVWNDLRNHFIVAPVEFQRKIELAQLYDDLGIPLPSASSSSSSASLYNNAMIDTNMLDECQLLDDDNMIEGHHKTSRTSDRQGRSSHELVPVLDADEQYMTIVTKGTIGSKKVPLYIDDGQFVFIDEETCIGCMQCVSASPSSFKMLDNGRARCYSQRPMKTSSTDVAAAVTACPVQECMHVVSFDELIELENARDYGIFDSNTIDDQTNNDNDRTTTTTNNINDNRFNNNNNNNNNNGKIDSDSTISTNNHHRHFGHTATRGYIPRVPLHVSRRDSDANHRSSFYHFIKNKCFRSSNCPQRGCYDCPRYQSDPNSNPYYQEKVNKANHLRAQYFIESHIADPYRTTAEL